MSSGNDVRLEEVLTVQLTCLKSPCGDVMIYDNETFNDTECSLALNLQEK